MFAYINTVQKNIQGYIKIFALCEIVINAEVQFN